MQFERKARSYLVDMLWPEYTLHVISGSSGSWKTSLLFTLLQEFEQGKPVLNYPSYPKPWVYVAFDRDINETWDTLDSIQYSPNPDLLYSSYNNFGYPTNVQGITQAMPKLLPHGGVLCLDGMQIICQDGNNYNSVANFTRSLRMAAEHYKITVIGLCHNAKAKQGEEYAHPRDKIMGSVAWGATVGTVLGLDNKSDVDKTLWVCPRTSHEYSVILSREKSGKIILRNEDDDTVNSMTLTARLDELEPGSKVERATMLAWGVDAGLSETTVERWITKQCVKNGKLQRVGRGMYAKPQLN